MNKYRILLLAMSLACLACNLQAQKKREFRGAWIQAVNGQWIGTGMQNMQQTLIHQLNELQKTGVNAIIFQVRPECDALYESRLEPWSRFLTGQQGKAPSPHWDPLKWMVDECHKRGMELHAWINPYRAKTKTTQELSNLHVAVRHPEWTFAYDGQIILNPGIPECRDYICRVVDDIVRRYDIDGLHIDDYFYPYPVPGAQIPDDAQYQQYNNGIRDRGDWRRDNVNLFIRQLQATIRQAKPWVKFGVSPFGIYRNRRNAQMGSATNGLQNYDDLYADVLMWVNNGWVDYLVPQLYWEIGHKAADYKELIGWWNRYAHNRPLYIGEDVERTVKNSDPQQPSQHQLPAKMRLHSMMNNVNGTVLWYAKTAVDNVGNYSTWLRNNTWRYPALQPLMPFIDRSCPKKVRKPKVISTSDGNVLFWKEPRGKGWKKEAVGYVVYRFNAQEPININDPSHIVAITRNTFHRLPPQPAKHVYVVTALNRMSNESKAKKIKY